MIALLLKSQKCQFLLLKKGNSKIPSVAQVLFTWASKQYLIRPNRQAVWAVEGGAIDFPSSYIFILSVYFSHRLAQQSASLAALLYGFFWSYLVWPSLPFSSLFSTVQNSFKCSKAKQIEPECSTTSQIREQNQSINLLFYFFIFDHSRRKN